MITGLDAPPAITKRTARALLAIVRAAHNAEDPAAEAGPSNSTTTRTAVEQPKEKSRAA